MLQRLFASLVLVWALTLSPAEASPRKPLVIGSTGQQQQIQPGDTVQTQAATTAGASINLPHGTAPTSPVNGDVWTTTAGTFVRVNGTTIGPLNTGTVQSVTCGTPLTGGSFSVSGTCGIATNGLALSYLAQVGGNSYLGNTSTSTGNVTAYAWPTCTTSDHALHYNPVGGAGVTCDAVGSVASGSNPFFIGVPDIKSGIGAPSASTDPVGSLYMRNDTAELWQQIVANGTVPAIVQATSFAGNSGSFSATPAAGDLLIAYCAGNSAGVPNAGTGWTDSGITDAITAAPGIRLTYKFAVAGESTSQSPCAGINNSSSMVEVSGVTNFTASFETTFSQVSSPLSYVTANSNDLALAFFARNGSQCLTPSGFSQGLSCVAAVQVSTATASQNYPSFSSTASVTYPTGFYKGTLLVLKPAVAGWRKFSWLISVKNAGTTIETSPQTLNCSTGLTCSTDGVGNVTVTNSVTAPVGANPTATAGPTAVNGSATTFMRSDAAPAVQLGSSSQKGIVQVDGTTITAASGVISSTGPTISAGSTGNCVQWTSTTALGNSGSACGAGGGGGTTNNYYAGALTLIGTCTPTATAVCTFSSIPQGYQDLVVVGTGRSTKTGTGTADVKLTLNGDTGSNYAWQRVFGNSGTPVADQSTAQAFIRSGELSTAGDAANYQSQFEIRIPGYAGTTFAKSVLSDYSVVNNSTITALYDIHVSGMWNSTAAVSSLALTLPSDSYATGTTISLYGRGGSNVTVNPQPGLPVISEVVTSGSQSSVTVSSIPSTYRDIKIVVSGRGTTAATSTGLNLTLNGDSGSNYDSERLYSNGTSMGTPANGLAQTSIYFADLVAASATAGVSSTAEMTIYNYAGTTFQKALDGVYQLKNGTAAAGNFFTFKNSGWWRSTSAVTSLTLTPAAGAFQDGTVVTVYGIGGSPTATLPVVPPQLRLTLTSNTPVMNADATAQTTVYATPYQGNILPVGNVMYRTAQISYALNTTAHVSGSLYDFFAYNASGAIALCTGPAWTNSTTRSAAVSQDANNAIWVNTASLTCNLSGGTTTTTIAAGQATYLGTGYMTANGQTGVQFTPAAAGGGSNTIVGLCNAYNTRPIIAVSQDSSGVAYGAATWRALGASNSNRISYLDCLGQTSVLTTMDLHGFTNAAGARYSFGVDRDSTSATPDHFATISTAAGGNVEQSSSVTQGFKPSVGLHFLQAVESGNGTSTGSVATPNPQVTARLEMAFGVEMPGPAGLPTFLLLLPALRRRRSANDNERLIPATRSASQPRFQSGVTAWTYRPCLSPNSTSTGSEP
jgi:hypothetical protein